MLLRVVVIFSAKCLPHIPLSHSKSQANLNKTMLVIPVPDIKAQYLIIRHICDVISYKGWYTICNVTQGGTDSRHMMLTCSICEQSKNCIFAADALCRLNRAEFNSCVYFVVLRAKNGFVLGVFYK